MRYSLVMLALLAVAILSTTALAQDAPVTLLSNETTLLPVPVILPDSPFYGLKTALENFKMNFLTVDGKAEYGLKLALYRVAEAQKEREKGDDVGADAAEVRAQALVVEAQGRILDIQDGNRAAKVREVSRKNIAVITALISQRQGSGKTAGLQGLQNALDSFQNQARMQVEKHNETRSQAATPSLPSQANSRR